MLALLRRSQSFRQSRAIGFPSRRLSNQNSAGKAPSTTQEPPSPEAEPYKDFRSPWFFKAVGVGNFILLPVVGLYATFYWDWGNDEREHVMQPARRWLKRQKEAFFSLSPSEQELAAPGLAVPATPGAESPATSGSPTVDLPKGFFKPLFLVKAVEPDGPAAAAGLRDDDLIVSFGEVPVASLAPLTYQSMIRSAMNENTPIPVLVIRSDERVLLSFAPTQEAGLGCDLERFQPGQVSR
ncbi:hypothetical protein C8R43DRAFT_541125 [Mycena crocata]|nr:hypothetical protein C8R43DRAFT_541125 [Mycena crocata]